MSIISQTYNRKLIIQCELQKLFAELTLREETSLHVLVCL